MYARGLAEVGIGPELRFADGFGKTSFAIVALFVTVGTAAAQVPQFLSYTWDNYCSPGGHLWSSGTALNVSELCAFAARDNLAGQPNCSIPTDSVNCVPTSDASCQCHGTNRASMEWSVGYSATKECPSGYQFNEISQLCDFIVAAKTAGDNNGDGSDPRTCNPISVGTGNKFLREVDYAAGGVSALRMARTYNSTLLNRAQYDLAMQWSIRVERAISLNSSATPTVAVMVRPDGKALRFVPASGKWMPDADVPQGLIEIDNGSTPTGWRYVTSNNEVEEYDAAGMLLKVTSPDGRVENFSYSNGAGGIKYGLIAQTNGYRAPNCSRPTGFSVSNAYNTLLCITDGQGRQINFSYTNGKIVKFSDPAGQIYEYGYDAADNLTSIRYPDSKSKTYLYENSSFPHALTGIIDENGVRYATYGYDSSGRAVNEYLAGNVGSNTLSFSTNSTTVTDALSTQRTYNFQTILGVQKLTSQSQPGGSGCSASSSGLTYDANGNIASRTDFNGTVTNYSYDLTRNLETSRTEASGKPEARTINTQWHSYWRLPVMVAEPLKRTTYVYNGDTTNGATVTCAPTDATVPSINGGTQPIGVLCQKIEQATTDANGSQGFSATPTGTPRTWAWTYTRYGQVLTAKGPRTDVNDLTTYTYYDAADPDMGKRGNLASITNALGQTTQITAYDLNSRPLTLVDPNGVTTSLAYDLRGRMTAKSVGSETTGYTYDPVGQLKVVSLPDGSSLNYTYDDAHRLTDIADGQGNRIHYTLDGLGNRTKEEVFDPNGQLAQTRSRVFDALSRLYQDVTAQNKTTTYAYDANGNLTGITDPLSHTTTQGFDALNRLIRITDPGQGKTLFAYNGQDRLTQVTDPRNLITAYTVDGLGNQTALQSPDTGTTNQSVDAAGNVTSRTDAKGQTTTYRYDALNRLIQVILADGSKQLYSWDLGAFGVGRLAQISEQNAGGQETGRTEYGYDAQGRVVRETRTVNGLPYVTGYAYSNGQLVAMTYPSGRVVAYSYDAAGRVTQIDTTPPGGSAQNVVRQVTYQPFGGVKSFTYGNGQTYTRSIDQDGRIGSYTLAGQPQAIGYDDASRVSFLSDTANPANSATYGYDSVDRLTSATLATTGYGYSYDATGNRTAQTIGGSTTPVSIAPTSNRIQSVGARTYNVDANGSTTSDGNGQYGYDVRGRMVQATTAAGTTLYQVNAQGERVAKTSGSDRLFHYDRQGHVIAEGGAQGQIDREYVYLGDLPVAVIVE